LLALTCQRGDDLAVNLVERDGRAIASLQKLRFFPLAVVGGDGSYLIDESGRRLLDLSASWGAASLGHSHPAIVEAVRRATSSMASASILSGINEPAVKLAEALLDLMPAGAERKVFFGHSGSDANETIARVLRAATGRRRFIAFSGAYHGNSEGSMAVSGHPVLQHAAHDDSLLLIDYPSTFFDAPGAAGETLAMLERRLARDVPGEEVAGLFIEPIQSDGGLLVPPAGFLADLVALCRRYGIQIVSDEVKVGLGRSGRLHCFEHEGFVPDFLTLGKGLGGGLPISAVIGPAALMDHATALSMQTVQGNPVCCAAGLAVVKTIATEGLAGHAAMVGEYFTNRLRTLAQRHRLIGDVRGRGLAIGIELVNPIDGKSSAKHETALTVYRAFELGLVMFYVGVNSNVLELTPPLNLSIDEVDHAVTILDQVFTDVAAGHVDTKAVAQFSGW
jgi:4-aminobutyrate aminotransferase